MPIPDPARPDGDGRYRADVAIVGSGVAGLFAATRLPADLSVLVVDKGEPGRSGSSPWAQGGAAAAIGADDDPDRHAADTIAAGDGLCDPVAVATMAAEAPARIADLIALGAAFDRDPDATAAGGRPAALADLHLAREGGQQVGRSVHRADATGAEIMRILRAAAAPRVRRLSGRVTALACHDTAVTGLHVAVGRDGGGRADHGRGGEGHGGNGRGGPVTVEARAVLLATGGCGGLFAATTNPDGATGDGVALAYLAGAAVRDLEFVQFHPTGLAIGEHWRLLLTEALRGAGATLHDHSGRRFMPALHPDAELAPRHVVAKGILDQPDGAWLDATHLGATVLEREFPGAVEGARRHGFDLATERVPVSPAAHYMVGGVRTDLRGRTSVPGLYAAGEVASTGVHGANRLAGNSLSEALVFGARAATAIATELPNGHAPAPDPPRPGPPPVPDDSDDAAIHPSGIAPAVRQAMWRGAGPVRTERGLADVLEALGDHRTATAGTPAALALLTAELIATSARLRTETRGGHWRADHPGPAPAWADVHLERLRPTATPPAP